MIQWWWAPVAWVIGELMGFLTIIICMGSGEKTKEQERKQLENLGLIYPENKKPLMLAHQRQPGERAERINFHE